MKTRFLVYNDARGFVKREVKDVKIIAASGSGRRFKISVPSNEFVRLAKSPRGYATRTMRKWCAPPSGTCAQNR